MLALRRDFLGGRPMMSQATERNRLSMWSSRRIRDSTILSKDCMQSSGNVVRRFGGSVEAVPSTMVLPEAENMLSRLWAWLLGEMAPPPTLVLLSPERDSCPCPLGSYISHGVALTTTLLLLLLHSQLSLWVSPLLVRFLRM